MKKYELSIVIKETEGQETQHIFRDFSVHTHLPRVALRLIRVMNYIVDHVATDGLPSDGYRWGNTLDEEGSEQEKMNPYHPSSRPRGERESAV